MPPTPSALPRRRGAAVAALAVVLVASLVTAATAQEQVQLDVAVGAGTRTMTVATTSGQALTALSLAPGQARSYRVRVTDADYAVGRDFSVVAENGNLYRATGDAGAPWDFTDAIPAQHVTYGTTSLALAGLGVDVTPVFTLTEAGASQAECEAVLLSLPLVATTVCATLLSTLGGVVIADLPVVGSLEDAVDLSGVVDDLLGLTGGAGGAFTAPSFIGIGAGDPAASGAPAATTRPVMTSAALTDLSALTAQITAALSVVPGAEDVTDRLPVDDVLTALNGAGAGALVTTLTTLTADLQAALLDLLFDLGLQAPVVGDLSNLVGSYTAYPTITVSPPPGTPAGSYSGTHTITLVTE